MLRSILTQALLAFSLIAQVQADEIACYAPDGVTLADNRSYIPCNKLGITQEGVYSSCCNLDGTNPNQRDLCTTTGLCLYAGILSRGYCTDKAWKSAACVNVCTDERKGGSQNDTVELTPCGDGSYCCGRNNLNCCNTDEAFKIPTQDSVVISNDAESGDGTCAAVNSIYKTASIGLGATFGAVALVSLGIIIQLWRQKKSIVKRLADIQPSMHQTPTSYSPRPYQESYIEI